ncbi:MAG: ATP-binding protein [Nocardioides sp.]|nr:ATP-binding protein [Nocardioides sp.]
MNSPLPSPYTPGESPTFLVGRREQVEAAEADLALLAHYGRFLGRVRVDIGSRGVGKTSLLKAIREAALEAGAVTAWVTARADESLVASLVAALTVGLDGIGVDLSERTPLSRRLRRLSLELGVGPAKAGVELDVSGPAAPGSSAASAAFGAFVSAASTAARDAGSAGLCLLVDEIQAAHRTDLRTLAYAWQELQSAPGAPAAVIFAAGLPNAPDVLTAAVTFSERFAFRTLERLGEADATEALEAPAHVHRVTWSPELLARVLAQSQGYPYFLQLYGDALWRAAGPDEGDTLGPHLFDAARSRVESDLDTMFRSRWAKASPGERRLLAAMAGLSGDPEQPVRRGEVAEAMRVGTNDLSVPRRALLDKGLIEVAARGTLRFTVPGFAGFVRAETGA